MSILPDDHPYYRLQLFGPYRRTTKALLNLAASHSNPVQLHPISANATDKPALSPYTLVMANGIAEGPD
jgi:hypothetical protein